MKNSQIITLVVLALATFASADMLYSTSFENEQAFSGKYTDTGDPTKDHKLINNANEPLVNSTAASQTAGDLTYIASFQNTHHGTGGITDGTYLGVIKTLSTVKKFTDGKNGYIMSDGDGNLQLNFATMDLSAAAQVKISVDIFIKATSYEGNDHLLIGLKTSETQSEVILKLDGDDIEDNDNVGKWQTVTATFSNIESAALFINFDSNSSDERIYIDNVKVESIPEPATVGTITVGSALCWLRKK